MSTLAQDASFTIAIDGLIVGYARSSSNGTEATARQLENLEAYSVANFGRGLDAFCRDQRNSGTQTDSRPGLTALEQLARGKCAVIIVEDMERISREVPMVADFVMFCDELNIELHTLSAGPCLPAPWNLVSLEQLKRVRDEGKIGQLQALYDGQEQPALRELLSKDQYQLIKGRGKAELNPAG